MSPQKVETIRQNNNNTTVSRLFLDENTDLPQNSASGDIPNPIETFEQCFSEYPDLMRKQIR